MITVLQLQFHGLSNLEECSCKTASILSVPSALPIYDHLLLKKSKKWIWREKYLHKDS